jgi:hypothetical protein
MITLDMLYSWETARKRRIAGGGQTMTPLTLTALTAGSKVTLNKVGSPPSVALEYSTGGAWSTYTIGAEITLASAGDYIKFRGDNSTFSTTANDYYQFAMSGTIGASGNVMSLVDSTCELLTIPGSSCFRGLFRGCTSLTTAPALPATTLAAECYRGMFNGCTGLTTAPALPATTLAANCYSSMFRDCTSLTTAPALPATTLAQYCYSEMFQGCTSLTTAPALPATTLATWCYSAMFYDCTSLTTAPALPATTLATSCYQSMFRGCASLTTAPALPVTTLATSCYQSMFRDCPSLTTAPALPATTLETNCYRDMFRGCSNLTTAPALPATTLAEYCYYYMFQGCASLTTAPALPATTLATSCYMSMFYGCTSLTTAPALPATTLATNCYYYMFYGCTKLSSIEVSFTSWTQAADQTGSWVKNVASSGTFTKPTALAKVYGTSRIPIGWTVVNKSEPLTFTALAPNSTVKLNKVGSPPAVSLEYSTGGAWATYTIGTEITLARVGDLVSFRGDNSTFSTGTNYYYQFVMTGTIAASGNTMSLVDSTCKLLTIPDDSCFRGLFLGCASLTTAPALPATTLAAWCYDEMFYGCTSLTTAPELPATTLAQSCYQCMFQGCASLTTAPALPATTLATYCYRDMFYGCTSLTTAPALPAATLAEWCYTNMFDGCTSLTTAPALPATTLAANCYRGMFEGCTGLSSIKVSFTSWTQATTPTAGWVKNVASSGTFTKPAALATEYETNRIPTGWTVTNK